MSSRRIRDRARAAGLLVEVESPGDVLSLDEIELLTAGSGRAVFEALEADRAAETSRFEPL